MRVCKFCGVDIEGSHHNRRFCSQSCQGKARYARVGQRQTPEQKIALYQRRCKDPAYREKLRQQGRQRRSKVQQFLRSYKLKQGCSICGYAKHHAALEFDHIRGEKKLNLCLSKSIGQAKQEMEKCQVLCSNCHKIETFTRAQV